MSFTSLQELIEMAEQEKYNHCGIDDKNRRGTERLIERDDY